MEGSAHQVLLFSCISRQCDCHGRLFCHRQEPHWTYFHHRAVSKSLLFAALPYSHESTSVLSTLEMLSVTETGSSVFQGYFRKGLCCPGRGFFHTSV